MKRYLEEIDHYKAFLVCPQKAGPVQAVTSLLEPPTDGRKQLKPTKEGLRGNVSLYG